MNPITHFLIGWGVANSATLDRRDRALVSMAGIAPDIDGLGILSDLATAGSGHATEWWGTYHHVLGHNVTFGVLVTAISVRFAHRRPLVAALAFLSFHLHLLGDVIGSRGPDGYQWPIPYLVPFSDSWQWVWSAQWALNSWPNFVITAALLGLTLYWTWRRGYSPLELISDRADSALVAALRHRWTRYGSGCRGAPQASR